MLSKLGAEGLLLPVLGNININVHLWTVNVVFDNDGNHNSGRCGVGDTIAVSAPVEWMVIILNWDHIL